MHKVKCRKCEKEIEGYNRPHANFLLMQHELKHRHEQEKKEEQENELDK